MMDLDKYDVVIVGGGPVGCITGENIKNHKVLIIEEHQEIGVPLQCAGLISKKGVKELGNPKGMVNKVRGAYIYSKNNNLKVGNEEIRAYVFERKVMDKDIATRASKNTDFLLKAYGKIKNGNKSEGLLSKMGVKHGYEKKYDLLVSHMGNKYHISPEVIVGADGVRSTIGKSLGLVRNREILAGAQLELVNVNIDDDFVYVFFDRKYSEKFFTWIIPMGKDRVRVGLCDTKNAYEKLLNFINNHPVASEMLKNAVTVEFSIGALPIGYSKTVRNNTLLVGDAAGQVKPLSGGGLYYGAKCAKICAKIIDEYLSNDYDLEYLKNYEKLWKREVGKEIDHGLTLRKIMNKMDDNKIDKIFKFVNDSELIDYINEKGDMDKPSTVVKDIFDRFIFGSN
jgi:geranylgeranyl reductase family protein